MLIFAIRNPHGIPAAIRKITATEMMEDVLVLVYRVERAEESYESPVPVCDGGHPEGI